MFCLAIPCSLFDIFMPCCLYDLLKAIVIHQDLEENMNTVEEHHIILAVHAKTVTLEGLLVQRNTRLPKLPHQIHLALDHIEAVGDEVIAIDLVETEAVKEIVVGIEVNVGIMNGQFALLDKAIVVHRVAKSNLPHQDPLLLQINNQLPNLILFQLPQQQLPTLPPPWELQTPVAKLLDKPFISLDRYCCTVQFLYFKRICFLNLNFVHFVVLYYLNL